jgi:hypothetical protein
MISAYIAPLEQISNVTPENVAVSARTSHVASPLHNVCILPYVGGFKQEPDSGCDFKSKKQILLYITFNIYLI